MTSGGWQIAQGTRDRRGDGGEGVFQVQCFRLSSGRRKRTRFRD